MITSKTIRYNGVNFSLLLLTLLSCVDEFSLNRSSAQTLPVIEGLVSDVVGETMVRISTTFRVGDQNRRRSPSVRVTGAEVFLTDNEGETIPFIERAQGLYGPEDPFFTGTIGLEYQLFVRLSDNSVFRSLSERMNEGFDIDSLFFVFEESVDPDTEQRVGNHLFFITTEQEDVKESFFYRVESFGIAQVTARLEPNPDPFGCGTPCFETCWSFRSPINNFITLANTENVEGNSFTVQVAEQPYDFQGVYFIQATVFSLSETGFRFWNSVSDQLEIEGSIFDPQITEIEGSNIFNESGEGVLGYFGASSSSSASIIFNRFESAGFRTSIPVSTSCRNAWQNATTERPERFGF